MGMGVLASRTRGLFCPVLCAQAAAAHLLEQPDPKASEAAWQAQQAQAKREQQEAQLLKERNKQASGEGHTLLQSRVTHGCQAPPPRPSLSYTRGDWPCTPPSPTEHLRCTPTALCLDWRHGVRTHAQSVLTRFDLRPVADAKDPRKARQEELKAWSSDVPGSKVRP